MNQVPTVYIIDDNARVLVSLARLVRSAGFQVVTYRTAGEFLSQPVGDTPGCLVLDIFLPDMNGLDLQQVLAAAGCNLPIVFMTAYGDIPLSVRAMKAGAVDFLSKSFSDLDLLDAIHSALERDRRRHQSELELAEIQRRLAALTPREREVLALVVICRIPGPAPNTPCIWAQGVMC